MAEDNQVEQFDPAKLKERIAETVQSTFGMLIPEDQWQQMVEKEIKAFFEESEEYTWDTEERSSDSWSHSTFIQETLKIKITPFRAEVWDAVRKRIQDDINKLLNSEKFSTLMSWRGTQSVNEVASDYLDKKLEELAPKMAKEFMNQVFGSAVEEAKSQIKQELQNNM